MSTETGLVRGVAVSLPDGMVRQELARLHPLALGCCRRIGLRNEAGTVYRWIRAIGLGHFRDVVAAMTGLGYVDDWSEASGHGGFDAVLSPDVNRSSAAAQHAARVHRVHGVSARRLHRDAEVWSVSGRHRPAVPAAMHGSAP